jgi:hypothetical protein
VVGDGVEVLELSEGVFAEALADYPGMELHWLQMLYEEQLRQADSSSMPLMPAVLLPALSGFRAKVVAQHTVHALSSSPGLSIMVIWALAASQAECGVLQCGSLMGYPVLLHTPSSWPGALQVEASGSTHADSIPQS